MDHRHEPVRDTVRPAFSRIDAMIPNPNNPGPGCEIAGIAAAAIVAWRAPSPSSPAPRGARRGAASGLDCSVRPSTVAAMPLTPHSRCNQNRNSPSQKLLTQKFGHSHEGVPGLLRDRTRPSRIAPLSAETKLAIIEKT